MLQESQEAEKQKKISVSEALAASEEAKKEIQPEEGDAPVTEEVKKEETPVAESKPDLPKVEVLKIST